MTESRIKTCAKNINMRSLRLSLKYQPKVYKLIVKLREKIRRKNKLLKELKLHLKYLENKTIQSPGSNNLSTKVEDIKQLNKNEQTETVDSNHEATQTEGVGKTDASTPVTNPSAPDPKKENAGWDISNTTAESIVDQVKQAANDALNQSGMVYVESAGMYYDSKTGYYYNSELGLYYHTDTQCYYYYSEEAKSFVFHSYPDRSGTNTALEAHQRSKAKKHKMARKTEEDIDNLTKNLSQDNEDGTQVPKKKSKKGKKKIEKKEPSTNGNKDENASEEKEASVEKPSDDADGIEQSDTKTIEASIASEVLELEDGECSDTNGEDSDEDNKSNASTSTASDDESIAMHFPPCMRVIVRETAVPKLRVGSLYIVTKDGGTVGREGEQHAILLKDHNVSRNHLDIRFDTSRHLYVATDLGSKNGTVLNGSRMSDSQVKSLPMEIVHGSVLQVGETKLLCHIHAGNDTCGHCEPGLIMEATEKEKKVAYTRTCNVQKQHQLELARLKNKYAPKQLAIEETAYNDRAQARRDTVGSTHDAEKTQTADINVSITPDNKGFKLLEKMGWNKGEGLGKDCQGETEPVPLVSNDGTAGLGANRHTPAVTVKNTLGPATMRLASRTKMLQPPAKAFQNVLDNDEDSE
ncbi:unnamed protein product [Chrysodeixis includens]|uniref:Angiogenic factor with G patch and FHA domains 1 n=1 Tax=Chrysodeixis includens TaxID=689277 RepID=A0A9P0BRB7_CHRIL|nr:unnamed protein product [Chrysodeixis includens]